MKISRYFLHIISYKITALEDTRILKMRIFDIYFQSRQNNVCLTIKIDKIHKATVARHWITETGGIDPTGPHRRPCVRANHTGPPMGARTQVQHTQARHKVLIRLASELRGGRGRAVAPWSPSGAGQSRGGEERSGPQPHPIPSTHHMDGLLQDPTFTSPTWARPQPVTLHPPSLTLQGKLLPPRSPQRLLESSLGTMSPHSNGHILFTLCHTYLRVILILNTLWLGRVIRTLNPLMCLGWKTASHQPEPWTPRREVQ